MTVESGRNRAEAEWGPQSTRMIGSPGQIHYPKESASGMSRSIHRLGSFPLEDLDILLVYLKDPASDVFIHNAIPQGARPLGL